MLTCGIELHGARTLGHNLNLEWGLAQLVFGSIMLVLAVRARRAKGD